MSRARCGMIHPHHPDCACPWCKAHLDEPCHEPAVATLFDGRRAVLRVCDECAVAMHLKADVYRVKRDDGRPVVAS